MFSMCAQLRSYHFDEARNFPVGDVLAKFANFPPPRRYKMVDERVAKEQPNLLALVENV